MDLPGFRNAPSLVYAALTPAFFMDEARQTGGFFRDGRASSLEVQAQQPFVTEFEMANADAAEVVTRLQASRRHAGAVRRGLRRARCSATRMRRWRHRARRSPPTRRRGRSFTPSPASTTTGWPARPRSAPPSSAASRCSTTRARATATPATRARASRYSEHALFTDFSYDNIGVPRNWNYPGQPAQPGEPDQRRAAQLHAGADQPAGRCAVRLLRHGTVRAVRSRPPAIRSRASPSTRATAVCGVFKVPSLRNVALTAPYFHNGNAADLHQALQFYITRDINNNQATTRSGCRPAADRQSLPGGGHVLPRRRRPAGSVPVQRPAAGLRCQRQHRRESRTRRRASPAAGSRR